MRHILQPKDLVPTQCILMYTEHSISLLTLIDEHAVQVNRRLYADTICQESQPASNEESDPDLDALCSQALMQLSPWNYYNSSTANDIQPMFSWSVALPISVYGPRERELLLTHY